MKLTKRFIAVLLALALLPSTFLFGGCFGLGGRGGVTNTAAQDGIYILTDQSLTAFVANSVQFWREAYESYTGSGGNPARLRQDLDRLASEVYGASGFFEFSGGAASNQAVWNSFRQFLLSDGRLPFLAANALIIQNNRMYSMVLDPWSGPSSLGVPFSREGDGAYSFILEGLPGSFRMRNNNLILSLDGAADDMTYILLSPSVSQDTSVPPPSGLNISSPYLQWRGDAPFHRIYINGEFAAWTFLDTRIAVGGLDLTDNQNTIRVQSMGLTSNRLGTSLALGGFAELTITTRQLSPPTGLRVNWSWNELEWGWVDNATAFRIYHRRADSETFEFVTESWSNRVPLHIFDFNTGTNTVRIQAVGGNMSGNIVYINSGFAHIDIQGRQQQLNAPANLRIRDWGRNDIEWGWIDNAEGYRVYHRRAGSEVFEFVTQTWSNAIDRHSFNFNAGINTVRVQAVGGRMSGGVTFADSDFAYLDIEVNADRRLDAPRNLRIDERGFSLAWDWSENSAGYRVYIRRPGNADFELHELPFWPDTWLPMQDFIDGRHTIRVQALGGVTAFEDGVLYIFSASDFTYYEFDFSRRQEQFPAPQNIRVNPSGWANEIHIAWDWAERAAAFYSWVKRPGQTTFQSWLMGGGSSTWLNHSTQGLYVVRIQTLPSTGSFSFADGVLTEYTESDFVYVHINIVSGSIADWWVE